MKKALTAINHPVINEYFRKNCPGFLIEYDDIQYQEGLLEILRKDLPDVLVLNEQLPGRFERKVLIEKIRDIDKYFKILIIVAKEDREFSNFLYAKGVFDVFVNDQAEITDLIEAINRQDRVIVKVKKEIPKEVHEELQTLKKMLSEKPKVIERKIIVEPPPKVQRQEIIAVAGAGAVGKSDLLVQLSVALAQKSKAKILNIDLNTEFPALDQFFGIPKEPPAIDYIIGNEKNSCLNYMVDNIDKGRFDSNIFDELVVKHKKIDNLHILTGNYSLYVCQHVLNNGYYKVILDKAKTLYDFIFIDTSGSIFLDSTQFAVTNAIKIFFVVEGTYANLRKSLSILNLYTNTWDVKKDKIEVVVNKYHDHSLDKEVIEEILAGYKVCQYIRYDSRHDYYLNLNIPMMLRPSKRDEEQYLKILENFNFVRKRTLVEKLFNKGEGAKC